MIIPVIRRNSNLIAAGGVAVDADDTFRAPLVLPVKLVSFLAGGLGAGLVAFAIPLPAAGGEDPGVGHGEGDGDGGEGGCELHFCGS